MAWNADAPVGERQNDLERSQQFHVVHITDLSTPQQYGGMLKLNLKPFKIFLRGFPYFLRPSRYLK